MKENLAKFRTQIDLIDQKILDLLSERFQIIQEVRDLKSTTHEDETLYIKPRREYEILQKVTSLQNAYPKELYYVIWRAVISSSNFTEQNLTIAASCEVSHDELFAHFAMQKNVILLSAQEGLSQLSSNKIHVFSFHITNKLVYDFLKTQSKIKIFARTKNCFICGKINEEAQIFAVGVSSISGEKTIVDGIFTTQNLQNANLGYFYPFPL